MNNNQMEEKCWNDFLKSIKMKPLPPLPVLTLKLKIALRMLCLAERIKEKIRP